MLQNNTTTESPLAPIISVRSLWKIFGSNQDEIVNADEGDTDKSEVLQESGDVIALNDVSFDAVSYTHLTLPTILRV